MNTLSGYTISGSVSALGNIMLYSAKRDSDGQSVYIKTTKLKNTKDLQRLENELEIGLSLDSTWAVKPITLKRGKDSAALIFEDHNESILSSYLQNKAIELNRFLEIAISITTCIAKMHEMGIVHKDIKPDNILINPADSKVRLIDFGISTILLSEYLQVLPNPSLIEGSLPYMSPEQTGRMNRNMDYRTDLYSLGVTFYQMITGELPFKASDPLEWVYCHIAKVPTPVYVVNSSVPKIVSDIIAKLLSKEAEQRYQSAIGLQHDLERCLSELQEKNNIEPFSLAEKDVLSRFQISQKLYGRELEVNTLLSTYKEVASGKDAALVLVSGYSGIGKTSLVNELHKPIVKEKGFFIAGKFDQNKRDIPYSTIVEAFKGLIKTILAEPEKKINIWKQRLSDALGVNGQVIVDIIPQIELIIGKQPPLTSVNAIEAKTRFNSVLENFIRAFATPENPLTIFLDDIQWADIASLNLIEQIITNPDNKYILLVGAYRNNEVDPSHPLVISIDAMKARGANLQEIILNPLSKNDIGSFIADSLKSDTTKVKPLARLIYAKTDGNPFFTIQFLTSIYREGFLYFNINKKQWEWTIEEIDAKGYTDNVVDLMTEKICQLQNSAQNMLKLASCVGSKFNKHFLSVITDKSEFDVAYDLKQPIQEGLILTSEENYEFLHDRVQQAAYSLLNNDERAQTHFKIGNLMLKNTRDSDLEENIFVIANHLSHSGKFITNNDARINIARLNLRAGKKARTSCAYNAAINYFDAAIALLPKESWKSQYDLTFQLHLELSACKYLTGNFEMAENLFDLTLKNVHTPLEKARVSNIRLELLQTQGKFAEAIELGLDALKMLGMPFPEENEQLEQSIYAELGKAQEYFKNNKPESVLDFPLISDPTAEAAMAILINLYGPFYNAKPHLLGLLTFRMVNISLEHGNVASSAYAYLYYGIIMGSGFGDYDTDYEFGKIALNLNEKYKHKELAAKILQTYGTIVHPWKQPLHSCLPYLKKAYQSGLETGDLIFGGFAAGVNTYQRIMCGHNLQNVYEEGEKYLSFFKRSKDRMMLNAHLVWLQQCKNLMGRTASVDSLSDRDYNEDLALTEMQEKQYHYSLNWYYLVKMQVLYHCGAYKDALTIANNIKPYIAQVHFGQASVAEFCFYYTLVLTQVYKKSSEEEKQEYLKAINEQIAQMEKWASSCPENFAHKHLLMRAELSTLLNNESDTVMVLYDAAVQSAKENGFVQYEALASELCGAYLHTIGIDAAANNALKEARDAYARWGAQGKVIWLESQYPALRETKSVSNVFTVDGISLAQLDTNTIIKASQAISEQRELKSLIKSLMQIVMEQAGATSGYLLLLDNGKLNIYAEALVNGGLHIQVNENPLPVEPRLLPEKIIQYVKRTAEKIIIADTQNNESYSNNPVLETKSAVCLPIMKQGRLKGMLYLENKHFSGAFTPERVLILELLSSQAAISIENASYYARLETTVEELRESEARLQLAMTQLPAILWTTDKDLHFTSSQGALLKKLGTTSEKIIGSTVYGYFQSTDPNHTPIAAHLKALKGESISYELESEGYILASYVEPLYNSKGVIIGTIGLALDISERKKAEEEIQLMNIELEQKVLERTSELQATLKNLESFSYSVSHDLRTPLRTINMLASLIESQYGKAFDEEGKNFITHIQRISLKMDQLIRDLLAFSKLDRQALTKAPVNVESLIKNIINEQKITNPKLKTTFNLNDLKPLLGDEAMLTLVFSNLISNAIKYSSKKEQPVVEIKSYDTGNERVYVVKDNGIGFNMKYVDKLFKVFQRLHSDEDFEGTGIGLATAARIIERHDGRVWAEAKENEGASFFFALPKM